MLGYLRASPPIKSNQTILAQVYQIGTVEFSPSQVTNGTMAFRFHEGLDAKHASNGFKTTIRRIIFHRISSTRGMWKEKIRRLGRRNGHAGRTVSRTMLVRKDHAGGR